MAWARDNDHVVLTHHLDRFPPVPNRKMWTHHEKAPSHRTAFSRCGGSSPESRLIAIRKISRSRLPRSDAARCSWPNLIQRLPLLAQCLRAQTQHRPMSALVAVHLCVDLALK